MMNKKHLIGEGFKHVFLMTLSLLCVFPFYWMIVGMTNSSADITMGKLTFGNKLAENVTNAFLTIPICGEHLETPFYWR